MSPVIEILNFKDGDVISYSLVLIKAFIQCDYSEHSYSGTVNCFCKGLSYDWPVVNGSFRSLAMLEEGINQLHFKYEETSKIISIEFRKRQSKYYVMPVYFLFEQDIDEVKSDYDKSTAEVCARIGFCSKLVQSFYAEKLYEKGHGHKTFQLIENIPNNFYGCHVFQSRMHLQEAKKMSPEVLWETLGREIINSDVGNPKYKFLGITSSTCIDRDNRSSAVALGSGGLALIDSLPLFTWPASVDQVISCFTDSTPLSPPLSHNFWYRGTRGGCCSASIGSLCHELGHTFDLGHPASGIMSTDFHLFHSAFLPITCDVNHETTSFDLDFVPGISEIHSSSRVTKLRKTCTSSKPCNRAVDNSSFTSACTTILSQHKWFNDCDKTFKIEFDSVRVLLTSEAGLKVVQMRGENGKVLKSWEFSGEKTEHMVLPRTQACLTIFAMDNHGNIYRFLINDS